MLHTSATHVLMLWCTTLLHHGALLHTPATYVRVLWCSTFVHHKLLLVGRCSQRHLYRYLPRHIVLWHHLSIVIPARHVCRLLRVFLGVRDRYVVDACDVGAAST